MKDLKTITRFRNIGGQAFLDSDASQPRNLFGSESLKLQDDAESWIDIIRVGNWKGSFKSFEITKKTLQDFINNFKGNVLGVKTKELQFNYGHQADREAAGWITDLRITGRTLQGLVRFTPDAVQKVKNQEYKFVSAEIDFEFKDQESGKVTNNVLLGAALTNIPFVKKMKPVVLSEMGVSSENIFVFNNSYSKMDNFKTLLSTLRAKKEVSLDEVALLELSMASLSEDDRASVEKDVADIKKTATELSAKKVKDEEEESEQAEKMKKELSELREKSKADDKAKEATVKTLSADLEKAQKSLSDQQSELDTMKAERRSEKTSIEVKKLSDTGKILPKDEASTLELLLDLSEKKAEAWLEHLSSMPARLDFSEIGSNDQGTEDHEGVKKLAEERFANDKSKTLADHMTDIYRDRQ